jgi:hypothetical protein
MHVDVLGHPIKEGMTVLTNNYYSPSMGTITVVEKVTPKAIIVSIDGVWTVWDYVNRTYVRHKGVKRLRKRPDQIIVIEQQLNHNRENYPENMI